MLIELIPAHTDEIRDEQRVPLPCSPFKCAGPQVFLACSVHMHIPCTSCVCILLPAPLECSLKCEVPHSSPRLLLLSSFDCILAMPGGALNSPLLQSTASQTKCSRRRVTAYAQVCLCPRPLRLGWPGLGTGCRLHVAGCRLHMHMPNGCIIL